jgi:hypothetical protein
LSTVGRASNMILLKAHQTITGDLRHIYKIL